MTDDIRIKTTIFNNPKIMLLSKKTGDSGVVCLMRLWCFTASTKPDGDLSAYSIEMIETAAGWEGEEGKLFNVLCEIGFLDCYGDTVTLHDWKEHQGWVVNAPKRSETAKKKVLLRWALDGLPKKEHEQFRAWFDSEYQYKKDDNTDSILTAYKQYKNGNTPLLSSPLPSFTKENEDKFCPNSLKPKEIDEKLWSEFLDNRKFKKLQNSKTALTRILNSFKEGRDFGYTYEQMIGRYIESGMQRFKVDWMKGEKGDNSEWI